MHYRLPANSLVRRGYHVTMNTSTPSSRMRGFAPEVHHQFTPAPVNAAHAVTRIPTPAWLNDVDGALFDHLSAQRIGDASLVLGAASSSLATGRVAKRRGAQFVLDRACPDIRVQQDFVAEEARKLGGEFVRSKDWFIQRQVEEYDEADAIICPSHWSRNSFPEHLKAKVIIAPLLGRAPVFSEPPPRPDGPFTIGVVGGDPLRKGYIYLLDAWKKLAWPNARLLIRSGGDLKAYPLLEQRLAELPNVEIIGYVPNLSDFYHRCDAFVLPSIDDGFGMALFEAIAHRLPCIATDHCGSSELLTNEQDALIVPAYSSQAFVEALTRLYEDRDLRQGLGENGARTVAGFHRDGVAVQYEAGMDELFQRLNRA